MKKFLVLIVGCLIPVVCLAVLPAATDAPRAEPAPTPGQFVPGRIVLGNSVSPIEQLPEMAALRAELDQALAAGDRAWVKRVETRIQAVYLAHQAPQVMN